MNFGQIIKGRRKELRMTQDDLCAAAELSKFKIVQIEKGEDVLFTELTKIGKALHMTTALDWLNTGQRLGIK